MKKHFQKHKLFILTVFTVISLLSVFVLVNNTQPDNTHLHELSETSNEISEPKGGDYKTSVEEKETTHFNIFTIINKFIPH